MKVCVLMPWGRVGSNLMMSYLNSVLNSDVRNEPFNRIKIKEDQLAWLRDYYLQGKYGPDRLAKLSMRSLDKIRPIERFLNKRDVKVIRMFRRNHLKTVVSQIRAEQYATLTKDETGVAKWGVRQSDKPLPATKIDVKLLAHRIKIIEQDQIDLKALELKQHIDIYYEDMANDMLSVFKNVSEFLGIDYNSNFKPPFKKATPNNLSSAILNLDEVKAWLVDNDYDLSLIEN